MTLEEISTCERCGQGEPAAWVYSDTLDVVVCVACAIFAAGLSRGGPGALTVEPLGREPCDITT